MPYQTGIVVALRDYGLRVEATGGWERRGSSDFNPKGFVCHHDAIPSRWSFPPTILIEGRSDLPGPLCNFALNAEGTVWLVAAGRANHAGTGGWRGCTGNSSMWGCEAQNSGTGQIWPEAQMAAYVSLCAACADYSGFAASMVCRHAEWTSRKIDAWGPWAGGGRWDLDMADFRRDVAAEMEGGLPMSAVSEIKEHVDKRNTGMREAIQRIRKSQLVQGAILRDIAAGQKIASKQLADLDADLAALDEELTPKP